MKKIVLKLCIAFLPVILLFFVNLYFSTLFADNLSDDMIAGKTVYTLANYNDRRLARKIVEKQDPVFETIVFSSSTGLQIGSEITGYRQQMNFSMTGGSLLDYIAILQLYEEQGRGFPNRAVLAMNAGSFLGVKDPKQYEDISDVAVANFYGMKGSKWMKIFSNQLKTFIKENLMFRFLISGEYKIYKRKEDAPSPMRLYTMYPDGHRGYSEIHDKSFFMAKKAADLLDAPRVDSFPEGTAGYFSDIKQFCQERGIELVVFLLPLAPGPAGQPADDANHGAFARDLESYVRKLSEGLTVRGTFSPYELGLRNEDFHDDESHMKQKNLKKAWDYIK